MLVHHEESLATCSCLLHMKCSIGQSGESTSRPRDSARESWLGQFHWGHFSSLAKATKLPTTFHFPPCILFFFLTAGVEGLKVFDGGW
jgi:hypothetical protein